MRLLSLALLLCACGSGDYQASWRPDPAVRTAAEDAAADWCQATDGMYCPYVGQDGASRIVLDPSLTSNGRYYLDYEGHRGVQRIAVRADYPDHQMIVAHELGHAAGIYYEVDVTTHHGVMADNSHTVTRNDAAILIASTNE